jgi:hypothetical protein
MTSRSKGARVTTPANPRATTCDPLRRSRRVVLGVGKDPESGFPRALVNLVAFRIYARNVGRESGPSHRLTRQWNDPREKAMRAFYRRIARIALEEVPRALRTR